MDKDQKAGGGATPTRLVIDRSRWLRGEGAPYSRLVRSIDKKMCCLGFFGVACGISTEHMNGRTSPDASGHDAWPEWLLGYDAAMEGRGNSRACKDLMAENDGLARESEIARLFAEHGVEVEFIDGPTAEGT